MILLLTGIRIFAWDLGECPVLREDRFSIIHGMGLGLWIKHCAQCWKSICARHGFVDVDCRMCFGRTIYLGSEFIRIGHFTHLRIFHGMIFSLEGMDTT